MALLFEVPSFISSRLKFFSKLYYAHVTQNNYPLTNLVTIKIVSNPIKIVKKKSCLTVSLKLHVVWRPITTVAFDLLNRPILIPYDHLKLPRHSHGALTEIVIFRILLQSSSRLSTIPHCRMYPGYNWRTYFDERLHYNLSLILWSSKHNRVRCSCYGLHRIESCQNVEEKYLRLNLSKLIYREVLVT